jgi:oligopeptide transport system ATP-binding protein
MLQQRDAQPQEPIVVAKDLRVDFSVGGGFARKRLLLSAVDGIDLEIRRGETLGLVGESGSGKTTVGRSLLYLKPPTSGEVRFEGRRLGDLSDVELRRERRRMQMIFQDPFSSLNPRKTVGQTLAEPIAVHGLRQGAAIGERVAELLELVGLSTMMVNRYPHEFSGGQRQRIGIARALAVEPSFIVCDEAVSALDVSVQAQIVNLLKDLQDRLGLTYLFISHGMAVVKHLSDRIAVMYLGKIVETAPAKDLYRRPLHPYTRSLLSAVPIPDPKEDRKREHIVLSGDIPSPLNVPSGCRFHPRCPIAIDKCRVSEPPIMTYGADHTAACWRAGEDLSQSGLQPSASIL